MFFNYATVLRMAGQLEQAAVWYLRALSLHPNDGGGLAALGFTYHLLQRFDEAVELYHKSLSVQPRLNIAAELLTHALEDTLIYSQSTRDV